MNQPADVHPQTLMNAVSARRVVLVIRMRSPEDGSFAVVAAELESSELVGDHVVFVSKAGVPMSRYPSPDEPGGVDCTVPGPGADERAVALNELVGPLLDRLYEAG